MSTQPNGGDDGFTSRLGGRRVRKSDPLICAGGAVDELGAHVGLCLHAARAEGAKQAADVLSHVQLDLRQVEAALAAIGTGPAAAADDDAPLRRLDANRRELAGLLPALRDFVLPGGTELACRLHVARTVCRRAERDVVAAADAGAEVPAAAGAYLNRLGGVLFDLSRLANLPGEEGPRS